MNIDGGTDVVFYLKYEIGLKNMEELFDQEMKRSLKSMSKLIEIKKNINH